MSKIAQQMNMQVGDLMHQQTLYRLINQAADTLSAYLWVIAVERIVAYHAIVPVGQDKQGFRPEAMVFSRSRQRNQWLAHIELLS